jgi:hypothetical protein
MFTIIEYSCAGGMVQARSCHLGPEGSIPSAGSRKVLKSIDMNNASAYYS